METPIQPELQVNYLGGPTLILEIGGLKIVTDPALDPKKSELQDP